MSKSLLLQLLLCSGTTFLGLLLLKWRPRFWPSLIPGCLGFTAIAIALQILVFGGMGIPFPSDVPGFVDHAERILQGQVPNRDFSSPYGFLLNYLLAGAVAAGGTWGILILFQLAHGTGLFLILCSLEKFTKPAASRYVFWLYAANPIVWNVLVLKGQDEAMLVLLLGAALMLSRCGAVWVAAIFAPVGFFTTKLFSAWILGPWLLRRPVAHWFVAAAGVGMASLGLWSLGIQPLAFEFTRGDEGGGDRLREMSINGNLWYHLERILTLPAWLPVLACLACLAVAGLWILRHRSLGDSTLYLLWGTSVLTLTFHLTYRMTFPVYMIPALPGLLLFQKEFPFMHRVGFQIYCGLAAFLTSAFYQLARNQETPLFVGILLNSLDLFAVLLLAITFLRLLNSPFILQKDHV